MAVKDIHPMIRQLRHIVGIDNTHKKKNKGIFHLHYPGYIRNKLVNFYTIFRFRSLEGYSSDNKAILGSIVFVFVLINKTDSGPIVGLTLCTCKISTIRKETKTLICLHMGKKSPLLLLNLT